MSEPSRAAMRGLLLLALLGCAQRRPRPDAPTSRIVGVVIEADGSPTSGVVIVRGNGMRGQAETTPDGAFVFALPAGAYDLVVRSGEDYVAGPRVHAVEGATQHVSLQMRRWKHERCEGRITPPVLISGPSPEYTPQALAYGIGGTMSVSCIMSVEGVLHACVVDGGLLYVSGAAPDAVEQRRYRPALCDGKPIQVRYTFKMQFRPP